MISKDPSHGQYMNLALMMLAGSLCLMVQESVPPASQPAATQPSPEAILDRFVAVTGGKAAYEKLRTRAVVGSMSGQGGLTAEFAIYREYPNKLYSAINIPGFGRIERGTDGTIAWEKNPQNGNRVLIGTERDDLLRESRMDAEVNWRELYPTVEYLGPEEIANRTADRVRVTSQNGSRETRYYDRINGLLVRTEVTMQSGGLDFVIARTLSDYTAVDGVKIPYRMTQTTQNIQQTMTVTQVKNNVPIPARRFEIPPEIRTLIDRAASTQPTTAPVDPVAARAEMLAGMTPEQRRRHFIASAELFVRRAKSLATRAGPAMQPSQYSAAARELVGAFNDIDPPGDNPELTEMYGKFSACVASYKSAFDCWVSAQQLERLKDYDGARGQRDLRDIHFREAFERVNTAEAAFAKMKAGG
ncbi:MAG: hypothetical protein ACREJC_02960 [Tepidisphaeraceae bacterium]